jgi:lipopolysaccharide/colanic/teichoic acid biosynthesis glycosyltransferase
MYTGKNVFDKVTSFLLIILLLPLAPLISCLIKIESKGPVFYKAKRVGRYGKNFYMFKFRTMIDGADRIGPNITGRADLRITKLGAFLRKTKVDELPSLINVLKGDMSLVGPRPETPDWVARYPDQTLEVLNVKPGITGPAQIKYCHEEDQLDANNLEDQYYEILQDKLTIDRNYISTQSLKTDLQIILKTIISLKPISDHQLWN